MICPYTDIIKIYRNVVRKIINVRVLSVLYENKEMWLEKFSFYFIYSASILLLIHGKFRGGFRRLSIQLPFVDVRRQ